MLYFPKRKFMNLKLLDAKNDPSTHKTCLDFLVGSFAEEFFPNPRIAKRVLFTNPPKESLDIYFSALLNENISLAILDNNDVRLLGTLKPMPFESGIFGKNMRTLKIYKNKTIKVSLNEKLDFIDQILKISIKNGIDHLSCKLNCGELQTAQTLERCGFSMVSNLLTYLYVRNSTKLPSWRSLYSIREANSSDKDAVCSMTKGAFPRTRFYNDPCLDAEACDRLYEKWAANCFEKNWASNIFVAENSKGTVVGYLTYLIDPNIKKFFGAIKGGNGISSCLPEAKGAYPALLAHSILDVPKYDASFCEYTTQAENTEVIRMWQKFGLEYGKSELVFHKGLK